MSDSLPPPRVNPRFRVALFGFPDRTQSLLRAVISADPAFATRYLLCDFTRPSAFDIAVVDMGQLAGREAARVLEHGYRGVKIIRVGRRKDCQRTPDDLLYGAMARGLVPQLNQCVPNGGLEQPANPVIPNVLIIDDSVTTLDRLSAVLQGLQMNVVRAMSGSEALNLLRGQSVDLVVTDVQMADGDGLSLVSTLRRNVAWKGLPIIMLSARSTPFDRARGVLAGVDIYLTKPVSAVVFRETVTRLLASRLRS